MPSRTTLSLCPTFYSPYYLFLVRVLFRCMQKEKKMVCFAGVFFCAVCCAAVDLFFAAFFVAGEKIFIYYIYIYIRC